MTAAEITKNEMSLHRHGCKKIDKDDILLNIYIVYDCNHTFVLILANLKCSTKNNGLNYNYIGTKNCIKRNKKQIYNIYLLSIYPKTIYIFLHPCLWFFISPNAKLV